MNIDIITYEDVQFAQLTEEQLNAVKEAQMKKNRLDKKLQEDIAAAKCKYVKNGVYLSDLHMHTTLRLQEEHKREVDWIREGLLFYLRFAVKAEGTYGYPLDYSSSMENRYIQVRDYYTATYSDPNERIERFEADTVAAKYLGEYYQTLYSYLLDLRDYA